MQITRVSIPKTRFSGLFPIIAGFGSIAIVLFGLIVVRNVSISSMSLARAALSRADLLLNKGFPAILLDGGSGELFDSSLGLALFDQARAEVLTAGRELRSATRILPVGREEALRGLAGFEARIAEYRNGIGLSRDLAVNDRSARDAGLRAGFDDVEALMWSNDAALRRVERDLLNASGMMLVAGYAMAASMFFLLSFLALRHERTGLRALDALRRSEAGLHREKEELRVTLGSIGDAVISTDKEGRIVLMNPEAERLCGRRQDESEGKPLKEIFPIFDAITGEARKDPVERVLESGTTVELANHTVLKPRDGPERTIADSGAPIRDRDGAVIGVVLVFRDITEKEKDAEARERGQRLESLGFLAGGIAHDFNNLLAGIFGYIEIADAKARAAGAASVREPLAKAASAFSRARDLTRQLLTFSRGGAPALAPRDLGPIIRAAAEFALSGSGVALHVDIPEGLPPCECDENQIGQVVGNIVLNAAQAMGGTGRVSVRLREVREPGSERPWVAAEFEDTGPGIPPEAMSKIFDPFFTTKPSGHGLGLATAYSIMKRHGGSLLASRAPGGGALFTLRLPALDGGSRAPDAGQPQATGASGVRSVLVMDDEDFLRDILHDMLAEEGMAVSLASNGEEALTMAEAAASAERPFDACILDLTVPGKKGGAAIVERLRRIRPETIIISMSGYSKDGRGGAERGSGPGHFEGHVLKPFTKADLLSALDRALACRRGGKGL